MPSPPELTTLAHARRLARSPKGLTIGAPGLLALLALPGQGGAGLLTVVIGVTTAAVLDTGLTRALRGWWIAPTGAAVTGLIISLVLEPNQPWWLSVLAASIAIVSKHLLRTSWSNIFNPAAFALVATCFLGRAAQSWWGGLPYLPWPFLAVVAGLGAWLTERENKWPLVLAFGGTFAGLMTALGFLDAARAEIAFRVPDLNAELFFSFFMLTDPPTSPVRYPNQVRFGVVAAASSVVLFALLGALYFLPGGLLVANVWESLRRTLRPRSAGGSAAAA